MLVITDIALNVIKNYPVKFRIISNDKREPKRNKSDFLNVITPVIGLNRLAVFDNMISFDD